MPPITGYNWEEKVFGTLGSLNLTRRRDIARSWLDHTAAETSCNWKQKSLTVGAHHPDYALGWYVPISYIQQFFSTQWWDCVVASRGAGELKVPRRIGTVLERRLRGSGISYVRAHDVSEDWLAARGLVLPGSVEHIGHGIVQSRSSEDATTFNSRSADQPGESGFLNSGSQCFTHSRSQTPDHWSFGGGHG